MKKTIGAMAVMSLLAACGSDSADTTPSGQRDLRIQESENFSFVQNKEDISVASALTLDNAKASSEMTKAVSHAGNQSILTSRLVNAAISETSEIFSKGEVEYRTRCAEGGVIDHFVSDEDVIMLPDSGDFAIRDYINCDQDNTFKNGNLITQVYSTDGMLTAIGNTELKLSFSDYETGSESSSIKTIGAILFARKADDQGNVIYTRKSATPVSQVLTSSEAKISDETSFQSEVKEVEGEKQVRIELAFLDEQGEGSIIYRTKEGAFIVSKEGNTFASGELFVLAKDSSVEVMFGETPLDQEFNNKHLVAKKFSGETKTHECTFPVTKVLSGRATFEQDGGCFVDGIEYPPLPQVEEPPLPPAKSPCLLDPILDQQPAEISGQTSQITEPLCSLLSELEGAITEGSGDFGSGLPTPDNLTR